MPRSSHSPLLALVALLVVGVAVLAVVLQLGGEGPVDAGPLEVPNQPLEPNGGGLRAPYELVAPPRVEAPPWDEPTTVLWPARVELDLIRADYLPSDAAVDPIGSGRTAKLSGRIADSAETGVRGKVEFVAGPNEGRVLLCDATGAFGATDLYPGLALVRITGPGILGAKREVRLRQRKETLLNLGFGLLGSARGKVIDRSGEPVHGARVVFDGQTVFTDVDGTFFLASVASGHCVVEVEHESFASYLQVVPVTADGGRGLSPNPLTFTLHPKTSMQITLPSSVGGPGPALVYIVPSGTGRSRGVGPQVQVRRYPWHRVSPVEVYPKSSVRVENLPTEVVKVMAFRAGATAREQVVNLREDRITPVRIELTEAPGVAGIVTLDGRPRPGVRVTLEAPDRVRANLGYLREPSTFLETEVLPYLPPSRQEMLTTHEGRYAFTAWAEVADVRYLEARDTTGAWAGRLVRAGEEFVDLALERVELGDSSLALEFPDRFQGLPVEILVNGTPQDPRDLAPYLPLEIESLVSGEWSLRVSWHGEEVHRSPLLRLDGRTELEIPLPLAAREGQDQEQWRRAGRAWPIR